MNLFHQFFVDYSVTTSELISGNEISIGIMQLSIVVDGNKRTNDCRCMILQEYVYFHMHAF